MCRLAGWPGPPGLRERLPGLLGDGLAASGGGEGGNTPRRRRRVLPPVAAGPARRRGGTCRETCPGAAGPAGRGAAGLCCWRLGQARLGEGPGVLTGMGMEDHGDQQ